MSFWSLLFPPRCLGCGSLGTYVCAFCLNKITPLYQLYCPYCRRPSAQGLTHPGCRRQCALDGLISCYEYRGLIRRLVTKFKYSFVSDLNQTLVELMLSHTLHPKFFQTGSVLVPVPLHSSRQRWRGFNQALVLAEGLGKAWNWPVETEFILRVRATLPQMTLSKKERGHNLTGAFLVKKTKQPPQRILLIDDVATTCATLNECAAAAKKAGIKEVWALTLAQALPQ